MPPIWFRSSMGLQPVNSSKNLKRGFILESSIPRKTRSPVTASRSRRSSNNRRTARPWNRRPPQPQPQQNNPVLAGQEPDAGCVQAKRPVGRPRKERRWGESTSVICPYSLFALWFEKILKVSKTEEIQVGCHFFCKANANVNANAMGFAMEQFGHGCVFC